MEPNEAEEVPIGDLKTEEGAEELADSPMMCPYVRLDEAVMTHQGLKEAVTKIAQDGYLLDSGSPNM